MALCSRTFVIHCGALNPTARERCADFLALYTNERAYTLPNGDVYVTWEAYKPEREELASRLASINLGISFALTQHIHVTEEVAS